MGAGRDLGGGVVGEKADALVVRARNEQGVPPPGHAVDGALVVVLLVVEYW